MGMACVGRFGERVGMLSFIQQHWGAIASALVALVGAGLVIRLKWVRSGRDTTIVNQKGAIAKGDVVGRDKIVRGTKRR